MRGCRLRAPGLAHRAAHRHRRRRPVGPRTAGLAGALGRRREPRRAVVRPARPAPREGSRGRRVRAAAGTPVDRRPPDRRALRGVCAGPAADARGLGGGRGRRRGRRSRRPGPVVAAGALAPGRRGDRRAHAGAAAPRHGRRDPSRSAARAAGPAVVVRLHPAGGHRARAGGRGRGGSRGPPLAAGALPRRLGRAGRDRRRWTGQATRRHRGRGRPSPALRRARPGRPRDATLPVDPHELRCGPTRLAPSDQTQTPSSAGSSTTSGPTPCRTATPGPPAT